MRDKHTKQKHWIEDTAEILGIGMIAAGIVSLFNEIDKSNTEAKNLEKAIQYFQYAEELREEKDYQSALANAHEAFKYYPNSARILNLIALIYIEINEHLTDAEAYLLRAISVVGEQSEYFYLYLNLGDLYHQMGLYQKSNWYYLKALELLPKYPQNATHEIYLLEEIGHNYIKHLKQPKEGIKYLKEALNINPNRYMTFVGLAEGHFYSFEEQEAIQYYQIAIQKLEQDNRITFRTKKIEKAEILHRIGYSYAMIDQYERALYHLEEVVKVDENHSEAHLDLAILAAYYNQPETLTKYLQKAINLISTEDWYQNEISNELLEEEIFFEHQECRNILLNTLLENGKITEFIYNVHKIQATKEETKLKNQEIKEQILKLISHDKISQAIEVLLKYLAETNQKDKQEKLSLISGQLYSVKQKSVIGIISSEEHTLEQNKIRNGIIQLVSII